jgi:beta-arabinofuranosyltransferase
MGVSALKEPGESKTKTPAKVILPAKPPNIISSDHRDSKELSSGKGALLGLANYNSDDDDDSGDGNDKPLSNLSSETNAGTANPEKKSSHGSTSLGENVKVVDKITQRINAEPKHEHTHDTQNGEFPLDAKTLSPPKDCHKMDEKAYRHLEKSSKGTLVKEEKADHTKELESSIGEKYDNDGKCSMYDKKGSIKENKGSDRIAKHEWDTREPHNIIDSKHDDAKGDRKDIRKDTRERNMDSTDRRDSRGKDEKEDRSRQITKSSTSHSSRRSLSRSPRGRSRIRKESSTSHSSRRSRSRSSDERSDNKR